jgi:hypothetical protein
MENISGTGPSLTAQTSSTASTKDYSGLNQLDDLLRRLGDSAAGPLEEADETVASHPLLSVGAAFLLGVAIGRLTKKVSRD